MKGVCGACTLIPWHQLSRRGAAYHGGVGHPCVGVSVGGGGGVLACYVGNLRQYGSCSVVLTVCFGACVYVGACVGEQLSLIMGWCVFVMGSHDCSVLPSILVRWYRARDELGALWGVGLIRVCAASFHTRFLAVVRVLFGVGCVGSCVSVLYVHRLYRPPPEWHTGWLHGCACNALGTLACATLD
jgi:hypothetical protein